MKKIFTLFVLGLAVKFSIAQVTIYKTDMPLANDTVRISTAATVGTIDYHLTGANYSWDYSSLVPTIQKVDTFTAISSTTLAYQFFFNNSFLYPLYKATVAAKIPSLNASGVTLSNVIGFYKSSASQYSQVGFGAGINGIPTSVKFDSVDVNYKFPLTYGNAKDSCHSKYIISVPTLGYYGQKKDRLNEIDGWGSLITPLGTFQTVRVKTRIDAVDTIFSTQYGFGFNTPRPRQYEYKWLGTGCKEPYLTITTQMIGNTETVSGITYRDIRRPVAQVGIAEKVINTNEVFLYPNPSQQVSVLQYVIQKSANVSIEVFDVTGKSVAVLTNEIKQSGLQHQLISADELHLSPSLYFVKITTEGQSITQKLMVE